MTTVSTLPKSSFLGDRPAIRCIIQPASLCAFCGRTPGSLTRFSSIFIIIFPHTLIYRYGQLIFIFSRFSIILPLSTFRILQYITLSIQKMRRRKQDQKYTFSILMGLTYQDILSLSYEDACIYLGLAMVLTKQKRASCSMLVKFLYQRIENLEQKMKQIGKKQLIKQDEDEMREKQLLADENKKQFKCLAKIMLKLGLANQQSHYLSILQLDQQTFGFSQPKNPQKVNKKQKYE